MKREKRVTNIGRQKGENEKRGYKSQSGTKKEGKRVTNIGRQKGEKGLQILEGKRTKMRKGVTNLKADGTKSKCKEMCVKNFKWMTKKQIW